MELLSTWHKLYKLRYCPVTLVQTAFAAGTVYLLIAIHATSGPDIDEKELRRSLDQKALVQNYLTNEIGQSWHCANIISGTLETLMNEQVRPHIDLLDGKIAGLHISAGNGDDEEENGSNRSRSLLRKRSSKSKKTPQNFHPHTMPSGSGQSSLLNPPTHISTSSPPTQVPPIANPLISPTTHPAPSAPTSIQSLRSSSSSGFTDSWALQANPDSNPNFKYAQSFAPSETRNFSQPSSDNPFSGNGNGGSDDVGRRGLRSLLARNSEDHNVGGNFGVLGSQPTPPLPEVPYYGGTFPNYVSSSSLGQPGPSSSHSDKANTDLDGAPESWHSFAS